MTERPLILLSNDDGVGAAGLLALREALLEIGQVVTVAPEREQSGNSHSITLDRPLRHRRVADDLHAVDGTPVDCIYVALHHETILPRRPSIVVSGINHGPNLGNDIFYSGTVAAAREGALRGLPAMAFSLCGRGEFREPARLASSLVERLLAVPTHKGHAPLLNVNVPAGQVRGIRSTRLGQRHYEDGVASRLDPRGREYYWIGGPSGASHPPIEGTDTEAVDSGYVSITPLILEATERGHMDLAAAMAAGSET